MIKDKAKQNKILRKLGINIKFYRNKLNLTQDDIADRINAERSYIAALESGSKSPSLYFLYELAKSLNISLKELTDINID